MWSWPGTDRGADAVLPGWTEGMPDLDPDFGRTFPRTPGGDSGNRLRSIAVRNKKPPACAGGSCSYSRVQLTG